MMLYGKRKRRKKKDAEKREEYLIPDVFGVFK